MLKPTSKHKNKVIVGMSGGIDSSVSAYLLLKQGYQVEGMFMKNWDKDDYSENCQSKQDYKDAMEVCLQLGIKLHYVNFTQNYWDLVFKPFLKAYQQGHTPNPDIWCNSFIKFEAFYKKALSLGADYVATGHYAKKKSDAPNELFLSQDSNKDQTYFLYAINRKILNNILFPLGDMIKPEVREIGIELQLITANKKDSTGICFIGKRNMHDFLAKYLTLEEGDILDTDGKILGKHKGAALYTIGQRGVGVGGVKGNKEDAWFVADKDMASNSITMVQGHNNPLLFSTAIKGKSINWLVKSEVVQQLSSLDLLVRLRHRGELVPCTACLDGDELSITFDTPQRAVVKGQSAVLYEQDKCLGGAIISQTYAQNQQES